MMLLAQQPDAARAMGGLFGLLCGLGCGLLVSTVIGAAILKGACGLFNTMVPGSSSKNDVPMPSYGQAMGIVFISMLIAGAIVLAVGFVLGATGMVSEASPPGRMKLITTVLGQLLVIITSAALLNVMLPTPLGRATLVAILFSAMLLIINGFVAMVFLIYFMSATGMPAPA